MNGKVIYHPLVVEKPFLIFFSGESAVNYCGNDLVTCRSRRFPLKIKGTVRDLFFRSLVPKRLNYLASPTLAAQ